MIDIVNQLPVTVFDRVTESPETLAGYMMQKRYDLVERQGGADYRKELAQTLGELISPIRE